MIHNDHSFTSKRAYGKSDLAMMYFPDSPTPHAALNRLNSWINSYRELKEKLLGSGYVKTRKFFSPREVDIITTYMGTPW